MGNSLYTPSAGAADHPVNRRSFDIRILVLSLVCLVSGLLLGQPANAQPYELNKVEFTLWTGEGLPDDSAPWRPTTLPFLRAAESLMSGDRFPVNETVWFRFYLDKPTGPEFISLLFWRYNLSLTTYFNGEEIASNGSRPNRLTTGWNRPLLANISSSQWRTDRNEVLVKLHVTRWGGNLAPILIGPRSQLEMIQSDREFRQVEINRILLAFALSIGMFTFGLWLIRRQDDVYLWFSIMCASWAVATSHMVIYFNPLPHDIWLPIVHIAIDLCIVSIYCFIGRLAHARKPARERLFMLWTVFAAIVNLSIGPEWFWQVTYSMHLVGIVVLGSIVVRVALIALQKRQMEAIIITLAILGQILLFVVNAFQMFFSTGEAWDSTLVFAHLGLPVLLLIFAAVLLKRFTNALQTAETLNRELEEKVETSRLIIERGFEERRILEMKQAAEQERIKIYRDLHDDVGSRLLSIIHADTDNRLGTMARAALESLRQAVSKANTRDQALPELLEGMREETELRLRGSGHTVTWHQSAVPDVTVPSDVVFNLNRIMKELVSNIIRHAKASAVELTIGYLGNQLMITVSDNGCGMPDSHSAHDGNGLNNIFSRAREIHARVDIRNNTEGGTQTNVFLPLLTGNA